MTPEQQAEYIVQAIREGASMYEEDARKFLAEHDAHVRVEALREAATGFERGRPAQDGSDFTRGRRAAIGYVLEELREAAALAAARGGCPCNLAETIAHDLRRAAAEAGDER